MQKYANLVELEKCCQTHIFFQNFVLIQPRTSPPKICKIILQTIANLLILLTMQGQPRAGGARRKPWLLSWSRLPTTGGHGRCSLGCKRGEAFLRKCSSFKQTAETYFLHAIVWPDEQTNTLQWQTDEMFWPHFYDFSVNLRFEFVKFVKPKCWPYLAKSLIKCYY